MKKSIKRWMKKIGCTVLATAVMVCSIPNQVYLYPAQVVSAQESVLKSDELEETLTTVEGNEQQSEAGKSSDGTVVSTESAGTENSTETANIESSTDEKGSTESSTENTTEVTSTEAVTESGTEDTTEVTSTEAVTESGTEDTTEVTSTEAVTESGTEDTTEVTSTEVVTESGTEDTTEVTSTEAVTESGTEDTTEETSTEDVTEEEASIEVRLVDSDICVQSYSFDESQGAYTKAVIKVNASASYEKANEDTSDEEAAELINHYAIKIDATAVNAGVQYIDLSAGSLEGSREFEVTSDGTAKVEISVVRKSDDAEDTVSGPVTKEVAVKKPSLSLDAVKTEINDILYHYDGTTNEYHATAKATAKVSFAVTNANEEQKQKLINDYALSVTDSDGMTDTKYLADAVNENGKYQVSFSLDKTFIKDTDYQVNVELKKKDSLVDHASKDIQIRIPRLLLGDVTTEIDHVAYNYDESVNRYKATTSANAKMTFTVENSDSVADAVQKLTQGYVFYASDKEGKTFSQSLSDVTKTENGEYQVIYKQDKLFENDAEYQLNAELKKDDAVVDIAGEKVQIKIPRLILGTVTASTSGTTYEYVGSSNSYQAKTTVSATVSFTMENADSAENAMQNISKDYKLVVKDYEGNILTGDEGVKLSTASVDADGVYKVTFSENVTFTSDVDNYSITAEVYKKNGNAFDQIEDADTVANPVVVKLPRLSLGAVTAQVNNVAYNYSEEKNDYIATATANASILYTVENSASVADSVQKLTQGYVFYASDSQNENFRQDLSAATADENGVYQITFKQDKVFEADTDYTVAAELKKNEQLEDSASKTVYVRLSNMAINEVNTSVSDITYEYLEDSNRYQAKSTVTSTIAFTIQNSGSAKDSMQKISKDYKLVVKDNEGNNLTGDDGISLSTATVDENGVYHITFSKEVIFENDVESYVATADVLRKKAGKYQSVASQSSNTGDAIVSVKIPRIVLGDAVVTTSVDYIYDAETNDYTAKRTAVATASYTIENEGSVAGCEQELASKYTYIVKDNQGNTLISENATKLSTTEGNGIYQISISDEKTFTKDIDDYTIIAQMVYADNTVEKEAVDKKAIKIPRVIVDCITPCVEKIEYIYIKEDNRYQAKVKVSTIVDYTIENGTSLAESRQAMLQNYALVVTDSQGTTLTPENGKCFWNDAIFEDGKHQIGFSTELYFDSDVKDYGITADVLMNGTSIKTEKTKDNKLIQIPRISTIVLNAPHVEVTIDEKTGKQVYYDEKDETYKVMKEVVGSVSFDVIYADEAQASDLLNGYKLVVQAYQTQANGEDVPVGKGVSTPLAGTGKQTIEIKEVLTLTQDGPVYAVAKLFKDDVPVTEDQRTDGPTISIPKIVVTTSEVRTNDEYVEHEWYEFDKWFSLYFDVALDVNYEVFDFIDDASTEDDNEALQRMLETSSVTLDLKDDISGKLIPPLSGKEADTKVYLADINQETGYELGYRTEIKKWSKAIANVIINTPKNTQCNSGSGVEIHVPTIQINEPTANITLAGYEKNEAGVYEALVKFSGNVPFIVRDFAPSTTTEGKWRTASDAFLDAYKVQLTLLNAKKEVVAETEEVRFSVADKVERNGEQYTFDCNLGMTLSTLLDKDDTYTAVYTVYSQAEGDTWEVYQTNKVEAAKVSVGIPEITFEKKPEVNLEAVYQFNPQNDEHSFDVSVGAKLDYNFFAGTADVINGTVTALLEDYKVSFALYDGETLLTEVPATEKVFSDRNSINTITFSGNFNTTRTLENLKAVVTTWHEVNGEWVKVESASNEASIHTVVIPTDIELKSEEAPAISIIHNEALCNHKGDNKNKVTSHELQVEGDVVLTFSGLTGLDIEQRKAEIANRVKKSSMTVYEKLADTSVPCLTVNFKDCEYDIIATDIEDTYQVIVKVDDAFDTLKSGNHTYYTDVAVEVLVDEGAQQVVTTYEKDTHELEIKELPQNFSFVPKKTEVVYAQDLAFKLTQESDLYVGDFTYNCYKVVNGKKELYATGNAYEQIDINTESVGTYHIEFTFGGDAIYEKTTDSTTFTVNKAPVTTVFYANCENFTKSHELTLTTMMSVERPAALKRYMEDKDIMVLFTAVPKDSKYQTITLGESEILFDDEAQKAVVTASIPHSITKKLVQETEYTLRAEIQCGEVFPYTNEYVSKADDYNIVLTSEGFKVNNLNLLMSNDGQKMTHELSYTREYKASVPTYDLNLSFYEVQNNNAPVQEPIKITYTSSDESVATVDADGIVTIHTAGTTDITIVADDATEEQNVYNTFTGVFKVTILSPKDTRVNLSVNGTTVEYADVEKIYAARDAFVTRNGEGVYWYDEDIVITIPEGSEYNKICYSVDGKEEQTTEGNTLVIDNELFVDYKFRLIHDKAKLNSLDESADKGVYKELNHVAIDKNEPAVEDIVKLTSEAVKSQYSTETLEYYSEEVQLTINEDDTQKNEKVFDYQSGVKSIEVEYGKDGKYVASMNQNVTYTDDACYFDTFTFDFDEINYNYHTIRVIVTDNMNKKTQVVFRGTVAGAEQKNAPNYEGTEAVQICVDTNEPDLVVVGQNADTDKLEKTYEGEWTDEQVNYSLSVADLDQVVSGIQAYQYAVLKKENAPEGEVNLDTLSWEEIPVDQLEVLFGIVEDAYDDMVKDGNFIYTTSNGEEVLDKNQKEDADTTDKAESKEYKLNGTVYFRAISNSGLIGNVNKEIKLWQTQMDAPNVYANNKPAQTNWYNKETGAVVLRFEYPDDYRSDKNAPAVGFCYEFAKTDESGNTATSKPEPFMISDINIADGKYVGTATIDIPSDSMNVLKIYNLDEAGNKSEVYQYTLNADYIPPEIKSIKYNEKDQELYKEGSSSEVVYDVFTQSGISVSTNVTYGISQKESLKLAQCKNVGDGSGGTEAESLSISPNARGFIYATAVDVAGNKSVAWANGFVADNRKPNDSNGIEIIAPAANSESFYHDDVPLKISVSDANGDDHAGLKSVTYSITADGKTTKSGESLLSFPSTTPTWSQIKQYEALTTEEVVIDATANEGNEVVVRVTAVDNAQNETISEKTYMIDVTKPVIDVTFDTDAAINGTYYNKARTARISITERNFDPSRVKFVMYKDGVENNSLAPSNWSSDETTHTATITFAEDGDYSFTVDCIDMADNEAEQVTVDEFTIDVTNPIVEVAYDQDTPWSDNYFNTTRTATITVTEHNFNAADFTAIVEPHVALSNWTHNGDIHKATLSFTQDNHYTLNMEYVDMAGNAMDTFATQDFYIDTQVPEISLSGVEDHSANAGSVVPVITTADINYDVDGLNITLTDSTGVAYIVERIVTVVPNGYQYTLSSVDGLDDQIYTLSAVITDKAGNSSEISCRFSLNRNGSTYDLREITELVEKKYVRYADIEGVHVSEMNVDKIEKFSIYMNKAGEVLTKSQAGPLPSKLEADVIYYDVEVLGNDETGYEYVYTLYRENFESEGIYNLMFYSKDRAGNEVNNTLTEKGAEITFVVDNTAPTVVIDGIEGGEFYAEEYRDVNVYVSDYTQVVEALFYLVDEDGVTVETYDYLELAENVGDVVTIRIPSNDKSLHLDYTARDIAGNEITTIMISDEATPTSFMITTNKWLQLRNNETALTGIIIGGVVVVILIPVSVLYFRRKRVAK